MFPVDVSFFEDVLHVIFVEIMSLDRYCTVGLRVVVYIVICAVPFQFVAGSSKLLNCLCSWIHYAPPLSHHTQICV